MVGLNLVIRVIDMKKLMIFCTGASGTGKSTFINKYLSGDNFYNLKSATTRPMREDGSDRNKYYFCDEEYFRNKHFATLLFVNEQVWKFGQPKWLYGVPEFEIFDNIGYNFTYDIIEPRYIRHMEDCLVSEVVPLKNIAEQITKNVGVR